MCDPQRAPTRLPTTKTVPAAVRLLSVGCLVTLALVAAACGGDSTGPDGGTSTGSIAVAVTTTGSNPDPDGYTVSLDGGAAEAIGVNENRTLTQVSTGDHTIVLAGVADHCAVAGTNPRTVTVSAGATAQAALADTCDAPLRLSGTLAFETNRTGNFEIFSMNADGTGATNLSNNGAFDFEPDWSPDGTRIAFVSDRDGNDEIYVMDADGSNQLNLTSNPADDLHPAWSPDGTRIAFQTGRTGTGVEVFAMNADGSNPVNLSNDPDSYNARTAWSPDGAKIAFASGRDGNLEIYVMNADGSAQTRLTNDPDLDSYPVWSPDGGFIAFRSDRDGNIEIFAMEADGGSPQNLTMNGAVDCHPTWSETAAASVVTARLAAPAGGPAFVPRPRGISSGSTGDPVPSCLGR